MKKTLLTVALGISLSLSTQANAVTTNNRLTSTVFAETVPPVFTTNYPTLTNATQSGFDLTTNLNEEGVTFYVILANDADVPTATQVSEGQNADGTNAAVAGFINNTTPNTDFTKTITSLLPDVDYDVYVVAKDISANLQTTAVKLEMKTSLVVLPVELTVFAGTAINDNIILNWSTAMEQNNNYFEVQHSADGKIFRSIGNIDGAGTSNSIKDYSFVDENPNAGINYYQLVQHDFDGKTSNSYIIALASKIAGSQLNVYAGDDSQLKVFISSANTTNGELQVFEIGGRRLVSQNISLDRGYNSISLPFSVNPGIHFVRFTSDSENLVKKFIR